MQLNWLLEDIYHIYKEVCMIKYNRGSAGLSP